MARITNNKLSIRLSLMVTLAMGLLLMAALFVMLYFSRRAVKEEALQKAAQTLDGTVQRIDNILLSVEQTTGNIFFNMLPNLERDDMMFTYSQKIVESNPFVVGCAIAFKPYFYENRELFMAYVHRMPTGSLAYTDTPIIQAETFGDCPYTKQVWFTEPMFTARPCWLNPLVGINVDIEPITTFCLPIPGRDGKPVGVIGVDVSLNLLSKILLSAKPSPNSTSTLVDAEGTFIVHPDSSKLHKSVFMEYVEHADPSLKSAVEAVLSGESGYKRFRMNSTDFYVFYKPFQRSAAPGRISDNLGWSAAIIYPADDISGDYRRLFYYVLLIAAVGLMLFFVLCRIIIHRQLKPLSLLTESAQRIAEGNYDEPIPDSYQHDEIGQLQHNFQQMQQSLATRVSELQQLTTTLQERGESLSATYEKVKRADRTKTTFLHNVTDQMLGPANHIEADVSTIVQRCPDMDQQQAKRLSDDIQKQGKTIAALLNELLHQIES